MLIFHTGNANRVSVSVRFKLSCVRRFSKDLAPFIQLTGHMFPLLILTSLNLGHYHHPESEPVDRKFLSFLNKQNIKYIKYQVDVRLVLKHMDKKAWLFLLNQCCSLICKTSKSCKLEFFFDLDLKMIDSSTSQLIFLNIYVTVRVCVLLYTMVHILRTWILTGADSWSR